MARDLPPSVTCKGCPAAVRWAKTRLGRNIPLESKPDEHGEWVLVEVAGSWEAAQYDPTLLFHHGRPRWKSHLRRCRPPTAQGQQGPPKPDPTAELKFPRRPARLPELAKRWPGSWRTSSHG